MKNTKVDIFIASYNGEKYIKEAIESVLNQSYPYFTLHIVDDCSTDNTLQVLKKIKDKRIIIYKNKKNLGMYKNINKCLSLAKAPFVKLLCCDDILDNQCIERQMEILEKNKDVALVFNSSNIINSTGKNLFRRRFAKTNKLIQGRLLVKKILKSGRNPLGEPSCIMLRKNVVKKKKIFFNEFFYYTSDLDMWINILRHGNGYYIDEILSSYRVHNSSGTSKLLKKIVKEHFLLMKKYRKEFNVSNFDFTIYYLKLSFYFLVKLSIYKFFIR